MVRAPVADNMASRVGRARHRLLLYIPPVPNPGHQSASQMKLKAGKRHRPAAPEPRGRAPGVLHRIRFQKKEKRETRSTAQNGSISVAKTKIPPKFQSKAPI